MEEPNHTANAIQSNWYQTLRKFKGNRWMWKPDTTQNMKLATIEITRGDTLISVIKGFLLGGDKYQSCDLSEFSPLFSHGHINSRDLYITHLPPNRYRMMRKRKKIYGNLVNDNNKWRKEHRWIRIKLGGSYTREITWLILSPLHVIIVTHLSHSPGPEEVHHRCWRSPAWLLWFPPCPHRWFRSAGC